MHMTGEGEVCNGEGTLGKPMATAGFLRRAVAAMIDMPVFALGFLALRGVSGGHPHGLMPQRCGGPSSSMGCSCCGALAGRWGC